MNTPAFSVDTIALSLLHFLWQGAAIAAVAGTLMLALRKPASRYLVGVGALVLMLISFGTTVALLSGGNGVSDFTPAGAPAAALASPKVATVTSLSMLWTSQAATSSDAFVWMARAWFTGVLFFGLRIVFGLLAIQRLRRRSLVALSPRLVARFTTLQARLGIQRVIQFCQCDAVSVPAVVGVFRPIVLLPMRALTGLTTEQLEAVVAHELGHILRFDVAVNFVQVIAETLLFFHPAVWWLNHRIRADREDCCDDVAVAACGSRVSYARALAAMENWRETPSFAMAATGGTVAARVARLLGVSRGESSERSARAIAAALVLTAALTAGALSLGLSRTAQAQATPGPTVELADFGTDVVAPPAPAVPAAEPAAPLPAAPSPDPAAPEVSAPAPAVAPPAPPMPRAPKPAKEPKPMKEPKPEREPKVSREPRVKREPRIDQRVEQQIELREEARNSRNQNENINGSYINGVREAGIEINDPEVVIALRNSGVTPEYIRDMRATGLELTPDMLIAMKTQDVSPQYVREVRALGLEPNAGELLAMRSQGVSAPYLEEMRSLGVDGDAGEFIAMRTQGVSPDYVREMRIGGLKPNTGDFIAMRSQGVTPAYLQTLVSAGIKIETGDVIRARAMDITTESIRHAQKLGIPNLTVDKLIQLKLADVL